MVLFGKSARKKRIPPPRSLRKILVPPPRSRCQKWVPPPQGAGSFSGQQGRIARKGHPGRWRNCAKGIFFIFTCQFIALLFSFQCYVCSCRSVLQGSLDVHCHVLHSSNMSNAPSHYFFPCLSSRPCLCETDL